MMELSNDEITSKTKMTKIFNALLFFWGGGGINVKNAFFSANERWEGEGKGKEEEGTEEEGKGEREREIGSEALAETEKIAIFFCQRFTSNFPFPFSFPLLFLSLSLSLRPFVRAKKKSFFAFIPLTILSVRA